MKKYCLTLLCMLLIATFDAFAQSVLPPKAGFASIEAQQNALRASEASRRSLRFLLPNRSKSLEISYSILSSELILNNYERLLINSVKGCYLNSPSSLEIRGFNEHHKFFNEELFEFSILKPKKTTTNNEEADKLLKQLFLILIKEQAEYFADFAELETLELISKLTKTPAAEPLLAAWLEKNINLIDLDCDVNLIKPDSQSGKISSILKSRFKY